MRDSRRSLVSNMGTAALLLSLALLLPPGMAGAAPIVVAASGLGTFVNKEPVFAIGLTKAPPADGKTPDGRPAYGEIASNGFVWHRLGIAPGQWGPEAEKEVARVLDADAKAGIYAALYIADLTRIKPQNAAKIEELRRVIRRFREHPALFVWKGADEPEWGKVPVEELMPFYQAVHELDPNHPVWITQAPRGTIDSLKRYDPAYDIGAIDIYPVGYPPGANSHLPNKNLSAVGDYANWMREITGGKKPFWMVLQIAWSGVIQEGKTLRFPTFAEERYMAYQAIINGARGLNFFGGDLAKSLNARDAKLGWNWTFYGRVLKPLLDELNPKGPLYPALVAPDSNLPVRVSGADDIEFAVREAGEYIYVLAAKREGDTVKATFSGLPPVRETAEVLFEEPRTAPVSAGAFTDWFGPNEVHVYRLRRAGAN